MGTNPNNDKHTCYRHFRPIYSNKLIAIDFKQSKDSASVGVSVMTSRESASSRIKVSEKDELLVTGVRLEPWKCAVTLLLSLSTFGLFAILLVWRKEIKIAMLYRQCSLTETKRVLIEV